MLPHMRYGLNVLLMEGLCPCHRPAMCHHVHREFLRTALLDLTTVVPATACHQRDYVEPYSRSTIEALLQTVGEELAIGPQGHLTQLSIQEAPEVRLRRQVSNGRAVGMVPGAQAHQDRA